MTDDTNKDITFDCSSGACYVNLMTAYPLNAFILKRVAGSRACPFLVVVKQRRLPPSLPR